MPTLKADSSSTQISENIFKLTNVAPIPFDITDVFGKFNQPSLIRFYEQHRMLGLDMAPFVFGSLVVAAVMLDGGELYNPDGSGYITGLNLFIQLIGEPGTNKSGLLRCFSSTLSVLSRIFPEFFSKPVTEFTGDKETTNKIDLIVNNDTELSLCQKLSKRENVFIFSDELDIMNVRFGVYLGGSTDNDQKTIGSRLLCQGYDIMKNVKRTTGSTSYLIERGSINIFGASTGNMLSSVYRQYKSSSMSDGTISRFIYIGSSAHKPLTNLSGDILSIQPNMVHLMIVIRILAQYRPIFVYGEYENERETSTTVVVPDDIKELINDASTSFVEHIKVFKPCVIVPCEENDRESDGSFLSPRAAITRTIDFYHEKSLKADEQGNSIYTPLQRAFYRKSGNKLARMGALSYVISLAIKICYELINFIRFGDGVFLKEQIEDDQYNRLFIFTEHVKELIKQKVNGLPLYGADKRPLIAVNKSAVHSAELLYEHTSKTIDCLFDDALVEKGSNDLTNSASNLPIKKLVVRTLSDSFFSRLASCFIKTRKDV